MARRPRGTCDIEYRRLVQGTLTVTTPSAGQADWARFHECGRPRAALGPRRSGSGLGPCIRSTRKVRVLAVDVPGTRYQRRRTPGEGHHAPPATVRAVRSRSGAGPCPRRASVRSRSMVGPPGPAPGQRPVGWRHPGGGGGREDLLSGRAYRGLVDATGLTAAAAGRRQATASSSSRRSGELAPRPAGSRRRCLGWHRRGSGFAEAVDVTAQRALETPASSAGPVVGAGGEEPEHAGAGIGMPSSSFRPDLSGRVRISGMMIHTSPALQHQGGDGQAVRDLDLGSGGGSSPSSNGAGKSTTMRMLTTC